MTIYSKEKRDKIMNIKMNHKTEEREKGVSRDRLYEALAESMVYIFEGIQGLNVDDKIKKVELEAVKRIVCECFRQ